MAIQFYMRAYNTVTQLYVDWVVNDTPDSTGVYAPGGNANLTNIVVNRAVQSKINNFLKPVVEPSYITNVSYNNPQDGYLFHLNSYDWLNPVVTTGPISIPNLNQPIGISVVRGSASTGEPFTPSNYASLFWEEGLGEWTFAFINSNGSIGSALPVSMGIVQIDGYLSVTDVSSDPVAQSGIIRLPDNQFIKATNSVNGGDATLIGLDSFTAVSPPFGVLNRVQVGDSNYSVHIPLYLQVDGYVYNGSFASTSQSGFIRNPATSTIVTAKGTSTDVTVLSTATNLITLGDSVNTGIVYNTSTGSNHNFEVNGVSQVQISLSNIGFPLGVSNPIISQQFNSANTITGQTLTLQAQNATGTGTLGGALNLTSGTGTTAGNVNVQTGGTTRFSFTPTTALQLTPTFAFGGSGDAVNVTAPTIKQDNLTTTGTAQPLTLQAQNATGSSSIGGALNLTSGTGTSTAGNVLVQTGGTNQIIVSPTAIAPGTTARSNGSVVVTGNLEVVGTTTTIDSTVVDIVGRVIHANFVVDAGSPIAPIIPAGSITGLTIHRGSSAGTTLTDRDSAGLIYTEITDLYTDGYWKHATVLKDIDTNPATTALVATMPVMGAMFLATPNPNQEVSGTKAQIPATGGFRSLNGTPAVTSRNAAFTQDLFLIGTDSANHIILGETPTPQNAGFRLYTTTGSFTDLFTNNVSEVQLGSDTNGPFVRESATTFSPASTGFVRVPPNTTAVAARNAGLNGDILLLGTDNLNRILHGDSIAPTNGGHVFSTTTNSVFDFWVNGISQVSIGANEINFTNTDGYATISQAPTYLNSATGAPLTIAAQSVFGSNGIGGNLVLSSGFGGLIDGYVDLQVSGITVAAVEPNKFTFVQGRRRHITPITGTYNVSLADDYIAITGLTSSFTIFLPTFPAIGDAYEIKDTTGNAGTSPVTVSGNGSNIDGASTFVFTQPYASAVFTFTGTSWSVT